ncbi:unnamed protein product [Acanthoscelides obtectus]|uniref:Uncharacterized protein n=1 Tax=Acanthoscelides obtectus TaxID=200917 RepID=A0A9P0L2D3_ACAOB|nr:unnamed protein product [Acanthoscelides obtectus]CAK1630052.1 hypothetical protein AOBTE_LOCUS6129 [Acanthoscelides obtectus]
MAAVDAKDPGTATFFTHGTCQQFEQVLKLYPQAIRLKADRKAKKPEELIKLDNWYQNELPKKIKSRGKDAHLVHEELVQCMKWKQIRGKFYPQLSYLVKVNTPRAVMAETKKAFRKLPNLEQAMQALSNLKGVGTTMASALLAAACPESAPFMADECLMAIPDIEGIDYTTKEYLRFAQHIVAVAERLNSEAERLNGGVDETAVPATDDAAVADAEAAKVAEKPKTPEAQRWSPHKVELALWTHHVVQEHKPELLASIFAGTPLENGNVPITKPLSNGDALASDPTTSDESNQGPPLNGKSAATGATVTSATAVIDEDTTTSFTTDDGPPSIGIGEATVEGEETNDSVVSISEDTKDSIVSEDSNSLGEYTSGKRPLDEDSTGAASEAPQPAKKIREEPAAALTK